MQGLKRFFSKFKKKTEEEKQLKTIINELSSKDITDWKYSEEIAKKENRATEFDKYFFETESNYGNIKLIKFEGIVDPEDWLEELKLPRQDRLDSLGLPRIAMWPRQGNLYFFSVTKDEKVITSKSEGDLNPLGSIATLYNKVKSEYKTLTKK